MYDAYTTTKKEIMEGVLHRITNKTKGFTSVSLLFNFHLEYQDRSTKQISYPFILSLLKMNVNVSAMTFYQTLHITVVKNLLL